MGGGLPADLRPICEFRIYCELLEELDSLTVRLRKLIKDLRVRGAAAGNSDLEKIATAGDGEIVEIADIAAFVNAGGLDKMITWWPLEQIIKVVKELYIQREQVKQSIYEITGIADIMRGASDPNETLGAQQIKTQWGSLRIQRRQAEVQRFARDIFRLKAEIVAKKFEPHIIADMVGFTPGQPIEAAGAMPSIPMQPPAAPGMGQMPQQGMNGMTGGGMLPGAPPSGPPPVTPEQVMALLKSDNMRKWRIDIETDSTIRADLTRNMESMAQFVQGSAQYFQAVAPIVQIGGMTQVAAVKIYSAFARNFKLGKEVLQAKVKFLEDLGVSFIGNTWVGKDVTIDDLLGSGFDAVFVGTGAGVGGSLAIPGEEQRNIYAATEFLVRGNLRPEQLPEHMREPLVIGKDVVVIGGGDTSMDCVRTAVRLGADHVTCVYRRTEAEMPGRGEEREHARQEDVDFQFLTIPLRFIGDGQGNVAGVECQRMSLGEPDESGRRRPVPVPHSEFVIEADTVAIAIGYNADPDIKDAAPGVATNRWNLVEVDRSTYMTTRPGVFAGGDNVNGADLVVTALADGRRAAQAIDTYLQSLLPLALR